MSEPRKTDDFIPVNQVLNSKPMLGPIPGEQVIPWIAIVVATYIVCQELLNLNWTVTLLIGCWGIASWWALTGNASWQFLNKFQSVPRWTRGHLSQFSLIQQHDTPRSPAPRKRSRKRRPR